MLIVSVSLHSSWTLKSQLRKEPLKDIWFTSGRHLTFTEPGRIYPLYPLIQDRRCTWSLSESRFVLLLMNSPKKQIPHLSPFCKSLFLNLRPNCYGFIFVDVRELLVYTLSMKLHDVVKGILVEFALGLCFPSQCTNQIFFLLVICSLYSLNAFIHLQWQIDSTVALSAKCFNHCFP